MVVRSGLGKMYEISSLVRRSCKSQYLHLPQFVNLLCSNNIRNHCTSANCVMQRFVLLPGTSMPPMWRQIDKPDIESARIFCTVGGGSLHVVSPRKLQEFDIIYQRSLSNAAVLSSEEIKRQIDDISEKFREAMDLINDARGSMGTVYFSEDMTDAESMINEVLADYKSLLSSLTESQRKDVIRTIGLKMEELKAQIQMVKDSIKE